MKSGVNSASLRRSRMPSIENFRRWTLGSTLELGSLKKTLKHNVSTSFYLSIRTNWRWCNTQSLRDCTRWKGWRHVVSEKKCMQASLCYARGLTSNLWLRDGGDATRSHCEREKENGFDRASNLISQAPVGRWYIIINYILTLIIPLVMAFTQQARSRADGWRKCPQPSNGSNEKVRQGLNSSCPSLELGMCGGGPGPGGSRPVDLTMKLCPFKHSRALQA